MSENVISSTPNTSNLNQDFGDISSINKEFKVSDTEGDVIESPEITNITDDHSFEDITTDSQAYQSHEPFTLEQQNDTNFHPYLFDVDPVTKILYMLSDENEDSIYGFRKRPTEPLLFDHVIAVLMKTYLQPDEFPKPQHHRQVEVCLKFMRKIKDSENNYTAEIAQLISDFEVKLFELYSSIDVNEKLDFNNITILDGPSPTSITVEDMLNVHPNQYNCYTKSFSDTDRSLLYEINQPNNKYSLPETDLQSFQKPIKCVPNSASSNSESVTATIDEKDMSPTTPTKLSGRRSGDVMKNVAPFRAILHQWQAQIISRIEEDKKQLEVMAKLISSFTDEN